MKQIFLVEDDKAIARNLIRLLRSEGYAVTHAPTRAQALAALGGSHFDLALVDISLPDGNGLEFCKKIRETSETPVLFLTANDTEEDMLEGFGVGCDDYISKPFFY